MLLLHESCRLLNLIRAGSRLHRLRPLLSLAGKDSDLGGKFNRPLTDTWNLVQPLLSANTCRDCLLGIALLISVRTHVRFNAHA
jgi:hypothetical protein